jgi:hypothetical protein
MAREENGTAAANINKKKETVTHGSSKSYMGIWYVPLVFVG